MFKPRKRRWFVVLAGVLGALVATAAGASWLAKATGSETKQIKVAGASASVPVSVSVGSSQSGGTSTAALLPGSTDSVPLSVSNSGTAPVEVTKVTVKVTTSPYLCPSSAFSVVIPTTMQTTSGHTVTIQSWSLSKSPVTLDPGQSLSTSSNAPLQVSLEAPAPTTCQTASVTVVVHVS